MQLSVIRSQARKFSRTTKTAVSDSDVDLYINQGYRELVELAGGLYKQVGLQIAATFDITLYHAIKIVIDDSTTFDNVVLVAADAMNTGATALAALIQTQLQISDADFTFAWDATNQRFQLGYAGATSIEVAAPSNTDLYVSAVPILFNTDDLNQSGATFNGVTPQNIYEEFLLPTDAEAGRIIQVSWDGRPLTIGRYHPFKTPVRYGSPTKFSQIEGNLRLYPVPSSQKECILSYMGEPEDLSNDSDEPEIPTKYHIALAYHAASLMADTNFEDEVSRKMYARFINLRDEYGIRIANQNPTIQRSEKSDFAAFKENLIP